jgi:SanA protein
MPRLAARLVRAAIALCGVALAAVGVANACVARREADRVYARIADVPHHRFAIVPGAMVWRDGTPSTALVDRLDAARALYAAGRVDQIFVSGDGPGDHEDEAMARWLIAHDVPAARIVRDATGFRTRTTMEHARQLGIVDAVVCTQQFHLPRSVAWAHHLGINADGLIADQRWTGFHTQARLREAVARTVSVVEQWLD